MRYATALLVLLVAALTGCSRYDFQIVKPDSLAQRITGTASRLQTPNMSYMMQAYENRLVVQVQNRESAPVELLGEKSFVVDPEGVSHPLRSLTIAPDSYAKLILPPLRPRFEHRGFTFGVGAQVDAGEVAQPLTPLYMDVYADTDAYYWDWDGKRPIRLRLVYRKASGAEVADEFTIDKVDAQ